jgi:hypothetical protein
MTAQHNHITRDIKPEGECHSCDLYHLNEWKLRAMSAEAALDVPRSKLAESMKDYEELRRIAIRYVPKPVERQDAYLPAPGPVHHHPDHPIQTPYDF